MPHVAAVSGRGRITSAATRRWAAAAVAILAILLLRLIPTIIQPSLDWGDEIYQATEPAHRLVFGTGLVTWEFADHIRSWIIPGLIAALMLPARWLGLGPGFYLPCVALAFSALSLIPVMCTFTWCRRRFGTWPAIAGAAVPALAPELVYFGSRTLSEVAAGHVLVAALFLLPWTAAENAPPALRAWANRVAVAGLLMGLALAIRPQLLPAACVVFVWPGFEGGYRGRLRFAAAGAISLCLASLLDWVTLGAPSASIWRYAIADMVGAAAHADVEPWHYYGLAELAVWGLILPVPVALSLIGGRHWKLPLAMAASLLLAHSAIGHKEHRYLYPAMVLAAISAGIGLAAIAAWTGARMRGGTRMAACLCVAAWAAVSVVVWTGPGLAALRDRARDTLAMADFASRLPGICGIGMGPGKNAWVPYGGYTHLHRSLPLLWPKDQAAFAREEAGFNLLLSAAREPGYAVLRCSGDICAAERPGGCMAVAPDKMPGPVGSAP